MSALTYIIYPNVSIGENASIGNYVIIGEPPRGRKPGELPATIGRNATIRSHTVIYSGTTIGEGLETGHGALIREENSIGNHVLIGTQTILENKVTIGNDVRIHSRAYIPQYTTIEDNAAIGPDVTFTNDPHPICRRCMKGPTIKRNAKIGAGAILLPHITIGENSLVGAGAIVVEDVPPNVVVAGCPARVLKKISDLKCRFGLVERPCQP